MSSLLARCTWGGNWGGLSVRRSINGDLRRRSRLVEQLINVNWVVSSTRFDIVSSIVREQRIIAVASFLNNN